jgi:release factor glutamine methyltransferase
MKTWTVLELIDWSRDYLKEKGFENARLETELLLSHALSLKRIELYLAFERQLNEGELARYKALLKRRLAGEPVQYVTGCAAFMFSEFEVTPAVLIPRPETEALMEFALRVIGEMAAAPRVALASSQAGAVGACEDELVVADIGTGSGVIATTVAQKIPDCRVYATDPSRDALEVAARNAERAGVAGQISFLEGKLLDPLREEGLEGRVCALISNPPYVPTGDIPGLPSDVRDFEPRGALDGGPDGLDVIRGIAQDGAAFLVPGGALILEVGDGQAETVTELLSESLESVEVHKDYAGRDRIVAGRRESTDAVGGSDG